MHRGRWVVYCFGLFFFFFSVQTSYAISLSMSATVPLSPLWKVALRTNSKATIDSSHAHILLISQKSLGIENIPVDKQSIQLLIFKNGSLVDDEVKITNKKGASEFVFMAEQPNTYSIIIINKTDITPFIVKSAIVSL